MLWNSFEQDRDALAKQYQEDHWVENSGMPLEELGRACIHILKEEQNKPHSTVKADLFCYILHNAQLEIHPLDFFADKINHGNIICNIRNEWIFEMKSTRLKKIIEKNETPGSLRDFYASIDNYTPLTLEAVIHNKRIKDPDRNADESNQAAAGRGFNGNLDFSHAAPAWEDIMVLGLPGLLDRVRSEREKRSSTGRLTEEQKVFYNACEKEYLAVIDLMKRYADLATATYMREGNSRMQLVAESCGNLAKHAPGSMLEAMQLSVTFYILLTFVEGVGIRSLGCLDRLLIPFYRRDLQNGKFTKEQINELIQHYYYKFYSLNVLANTPFTLCSIDQTGKSTCNELTEVLLDVYGTLDIIDPKIQIRYNPQVPDSFLQKALALIIKGESSIVFMNDNIVIRGLCALGEELCDARNYIPVGCYEPMALGTEVPCSCNGRINLPKAVELAFTGGVDALNGDVLAKPFPEPTTWAEFYGRVLLIVQEFADRSMALINGYESCYAGINPSPLFSGTYRSCTENGTDAYTGGAKYNNSSINVFGIADVVDSMIVVKKAVFEEKLVSYQDLSRILRNDWQGHGKLRLICKNKFPRYGNGDPEADELSVRLVDEVSAMINGKPNGRGGIYRCGGFSIDACEFFGDITGALPDGRLAGELLSKNMCPVVGADKKGVTALIRSVTKIDYSRIPNGTVLDIVLHESAVSGDDGKAAMLTLLKTYMSLGGLAIHFNVLDPSVLRRAQLYPEEYQTLQIRLCGWNVYFVNLNKKEQNSFIQCAEHAAS